MATVATCDVLVVGGGFAGAATAYHLAQAGGVRVGVVEQEPVAGMHASGRNASLCSAVHRDPRIGELTAAGAAFIAAPPEGFAARPLLRPTGSLWASHDGQQLNAMGDSARAHGVRYELVDRSWIKRRFPRLVTDALVGAVLVVDDGIVDIRGLLAGYVDGAKARGAQFFFSSGASAFRETSRGVDVVTAQGVIHAQIVVNAAGAWAGQLGVLAGAGDAGIQPRLRHLHLTAPTSGVSPDAPYVWCLGNDEFYFRAQGSRYLVCACDDPVWRPANVQPQESAYAQLQYALRRWMPSLVGHEIETSWAGLRTFTPEGPRIGWDRSVPWLYWVAGVGGHGMTASSPIGRLAAAEILHRRR